MSNSVENPHEQVCALLASIAGKRRISCAVEFLDRTGGRRHRDSLKWASDTPTSAPLIVKLKPDASRCGTWHFFYSAS